MIDLLIVTYIIKHRKILEECKKEIELNKKALF